MSTVQVSKTCDSGGQERTILLLDKILKEPRCHVSKRVHRNNLLLVCPLWEWSNIGSRLGVGKIRSLRDFMLALSRKDENAAEYYSAYL